MQDGVANKLAAQRDFDRDTDEPDRFTWWGALIPDKQREAMMAEAIAQLRAQGHKDVEAPEGPSAGFEVCCGSVTARSPSR